LAAALDGDAVIAAVEDQSCAGYAATGCIGHARGGGGGSGEDVVAGFAGVDEPFSGSAAAVGGYHYVPQGGHVVDLGLAAVFAGVVSGGQQDEVEFVGDGGGGRGLSGDVSEGAGAHDGDAFGFRVFEVAAGYGDYGLFRGGMGCRVGGAVGASGAEQDSFYRLGGVGALGCQSLLFAVKDDDGGIDGVGLLPETSVAAEGCFAGGLMELGFR